MALLDQQLPDVEGHTLCPTILRFNDQTKIIFITAYPSFDGAVKAVRLGAYDYLSKPFELAELDLAVGKALQTLSLEKVATLQDYRTNRKSEQAVIVGGNGGLAEIMELVGLASSADSPVLITGETGTGKTAIAGAIHYRSSAERAAFVSINCAALPENLIEAELFGYEKGAFTGAIAARKGIFEMAEGGTLFLDEIGEIPLHLQSKLLSAIEEKKIRRLGGESMRPVEVRIIASTSVPLETVIGSTFRKDLYYRLNVIRIHIPPLRQRPQDISELCRHLLKRISKGREIDLPDSEIARLTAYDWPGNVRELRNVLERSFILQRGSALRPSELIQTAGGRRADSPRSCDTDDKQATLADMERSHIEKTLESLGGNRTQAARTLGISLSTLKRKLQEYGLK